MAEGMIFTPGAFKDLPKEVPLKDKPGGNIIGTAIVRETEQGIVVDATMSVCWACALQRCDSAMNDKNCRCCARNHGR